MDYLELDAKVIELEQRVQMLEALCSQLSCDLKEIKEAIQDAKNT